jgi:hypothetical protein
MCVGHGYPQLCSRSSPDLCVAESIATLPRGICISRMNACRPTHDGMRSQSCPTRLIQPTLLGVPKRWDEQRGGVEPMLRLSDSQASREDRRRSGPIQGLD